MTTDFNINVTFSKEVLDDLVAKFGVEGAIKEVSETLQAAVFAHMAALRETLTGNP